MDNIIYIWLFPARTSPEKSRHLHCTSLPSDNKAAAPCAKTGHSTSASRPCFVAALASCDAGPQNATTCSSRNIRKAAKKSLLETWALCFGLSLACQASLKLTRFGDKKRPPPAWTTPHVSRFGIVESLSSRPLQAKSESEFWPSWPAVAGLAAGMTRRTVIVHSVCLASCH